MQELTCQEQRGVCVCGSATGVRRRADWSQRRSGGAAVLPHRWMQRGCLLLVPRRAGGSVGGGRRRTMRWPTDGGHLSNAGGEGSPALSSSTASVRHGNDGATERRIDGREAMAHPYPARQMSDVGFGKTLKVRTLGCARRSSPYRSTPQSLVANLGYSMNNRRDTRFILVRAIIVV